jgi:hypothetical protein
MILLGMEAPEGGWLLEDVEAALWQAEAMGRVMPRDKFVQRSGSGSMDELGSMM